MTPVFDDRPCMLGEGPLWHPERQQFFWFDILNRQLMTRDGNHPRSWEFDELVSAAGWVDQDVLLVASESGLWRFNLECGHKERVTSIEADQTETRSNDGRADPWGGFWIGTMGKRAEAGAGSIYRYYRGEVRRLVTDVTITNAICFAPDRSCAYYSDTASGQVMRQPLDPETGWPQEEPQLYLDLTVEGLNPDGAVTDSAGNIWIAQWGASRVAAYDPNGKFLKAVGFPAKHTSCPAFGGKGLTTLFCTSARQGLDAETLETHPLNGATFAAPDVATGLPEPRVIL